MDTHTHTLKIDSRMLNFLRGRDLVFADQKDMGLIGIVLSCHTRGFSHHFHHGFQHGWPGILLVSQTPSFFGPPDLGPAETNKTRGLHGATSRKMPITLLGKQDLHSR